MKVDGRRAQRRAGRHERYFLVESVLELEPPLLDGDPEVVVSRGVLGVAVGGGGVEGGDADGLRSPPGRSPTRSVPESVQAVASVETNASAARAISALFMRDLLG